MAEKQTGTRTGTSRSGTRARQSTSRKDGATAGPSVPVPVLVPQVQVRHVPVPRVAMGHVSMPKVSVPKVSLPIPDQLRHVPNPVDNKLLWYGGLAGLAATGVIGWPVAGVVAAGTYVAEQRARNAVADSGDGARTGQKSAGRTSSGTRSR